MICAANEIIIEFLSRITSEEVFGLGSHVKPAQSSEESGRSGRHAI